MTYDEDGVKGSQSRSEELEGKAISSEWVTVDLYNWVFSRIRG
jgi:hypothetical protein